MAKLRVPVNDEMGVGMDRQGWLGSIIMTRGTEEIGVLILDLVRDFPDRTDTEPDNHRGLSFSSGSFEYRVCRILPSHSKIRLIVVSSALSSGCR